MPAPIIAGVARAAAGAATRTAATTAARGAARSAAPAARPAPAPRTIRMPTTRQYRPGMAPPGTASRAPTNHAEAKAEHKAEQERLQARNDKVVDALAAAAEALDASQNHFAHAITVSVRGGPRASLRRCWFLCLAALFGRRRRGVESLWAETINAQWDITGKSVTATLAYTIGSISDPWTNFIDAEHPGAMLQRGPDQVTIGAGWSSTYLTLNQQLGNFTGLNKGLNNARLVGGQVVVNPTNTLPPIQGELPDPTKANRLGQTPPGVHTLTAGSLHNINIDPGNVFFGWRIDKQTVDAMQPRPVAIVQPYTVVQTNNPLSEMPVRQPGGGAEALPYQAHKPTNQGEGLQYVWRGGSIGAVPKLPDDGRIITTGEKLNHMVQPPRPPVDGISRGHLLVMVAAQLASPGMLVEAPPNLPDNTETLACEGVFLRQPNTQNVAPLTTDKYRYQPAAVVAQVRTLIDAFRLDLGGQYVPATTVNVRPVGN